MSSEATGSMRDLVQRIRAEEACTVFPPEGQPQVAASDVVPDDLREFYEHCGGVLFFGDSAFTMEISAPSRLVKSNPEIRGVSAAEDRSDSWYIVGRGENSEAISIDLSPGRLGRCYDSFWDRHALAGSCPIIAGSFSELLVRLLAARGGEWYWTAADFDSMGDAYDN